MPYKDKEKQKAYQKVYCKLYYLANKDRIIARAKAYQKANLGKTNPEKTRLAKKKYRLAHPDKIKARKATYRLAHPEKGKMYKRKRRAMKMGSNHEPYTDVYIFERDNWICGICGQKINKRLKYPNERSKSIDHIVPISKGGADAPVNVQSAHLRCNVSKNAGGGGQLRLVG